MYGLVAQWIRHLTTNQGIAGSSPARVNSFLLYISITAVIGDCLHDKIMRPRVGSNHQPFG